MPDYIAYTLALFVWAVACIFFMLVARLSEKGEMCLLLAAGPWMWAGLLVALAAHLLKGGAEWLGQRLS